MSYVEKDDPSAYRDRGIQHIGSAYAQNYPGLDASGPVNSTLPSSSGIISGLRVNHFYTAFPAHIVGKAFGQGRISQ